jgi:hypothetical protein
VPGGEELSPNTAIVTVGQGWGGERRLYSRQFNLADVDKLADRLSIGRLIEHHR